MRQGNAERGGGGRGAIVASDNFDNYDIAGLDLSNPVSQSPRAP